MSQSERWRNMNPYDLHKTLVNEYLLMHKNKALIFQRDESKDKRDMDVIKENHQFLWDDKKDISELSWEKKLAKQYYDKLYKEYCVGDFSKYIENKIGLRWRTQQELIDGKGQFSCGNKKCNKKNGLKSWEVNFGYFEFGVKKNALVKLRLCPDCSKKLNWHHKKKEIKRLQKSHKNSKNCEVIQEPSEFNIKKTTNVSKVNDKELKSKQSETEIWKNIEKEEEEVKSRDEEFDEYLSQLFL